jgi:hypothetical protein
MDENEQGDLNRIPIGAALYQQYLLLQEEYSYALRICGHSTKYEYTEMRTMFSMASAQGQYPELMKSYLEKWDALNQRYGNPEQTGWEFRSSEAGERKKLLEEMLFNIGITRMDSRPQPPEIQRFDYGYRFDARVIIDSYWKQREKENRNLNIVCCGKVGGGKSYASLSVGNYLNQNYNLENICYEVSEFIGRMQSQAKGTVIVLDEAGSAAGSRDSMTAASKSLSKTIQSTRYLQMVSIFNIPNLAFLDRQVKTMLDLVFTHEEEMRQGEFAVAVPDLTADGKDIEFHSIRYDSKIIKTVYFPLPPPYLISEYESLRRQHNLTQLSNLKEKLSPSVKEDGRGKSPNSIKNLKPFKGD